MSYSLPSGTKLGDGYEIRGVLGSGGFGITYQAWDVEFHRLVAIKEYFPFDLAIRASGSDSVVSRDAGTKDDLAKGMVQFVEEGRTLAKFADDRIVRATNFVKANDTVYMVMEYQEGRSLSEFLAEQKRPLSEQEVLNIFVPIMQALEKVHRASILHRDLKPDNIYIRNDGAPLLLDFGAARQKVLGKSRSLTSMLSPGYAPLEQYHARGNQGPWTDIYALGATMYFCTTGKKPENVTARVGASNAGIPDPMPPAVQAGAQLYSETLLSTIDWMLKLNERQRPQSLSEVLTRLSGIGSQPESGGAPGAVQTRIAPANVLQKNEINPTKTEIYEYKSSDAAQHSSGRKKPVVLIAAVGLLVFLLAGIGFTQWSKWADTPKNAERQLLPEETPGEVARVNSEQEETARLAEEKRQKEEATRLAEEQRRKAEAARIAKEQRLKEETARLEEENRREVEETSWRTAESVNTRTSYQAYLDQYGAGKYAKAARTRIGEIEKADADRLAEEKRRLEEEKRQQEEAARLAEQQKKKEETERLAEAKRQKEEATGLAIEQRRKAEAARIAEEQRQKEETARLAEEKRQQVEEASWRMAEGVNTRASYRAYLEQYGAGKYAKAARTRIRKIEKAKADRLAEEERRLEEEKRQQQESARLAEQQRKKEETKRLAGEKKQKDEEAIWRKAKTADTLKAYQTYLDNCSLCEYDTYARTRTQELVQEESAQLAAEKQKKEEAARIAEEKRRQAEEALRLIEPEMVRVGNFSVGKYEVTQGQWRAVMGSNPSQFKKGDDYPVETFSWDDLQEYIRRLNSKTGKRYRLPTEDEWYRACQGGGAEQDYCGGKDLDQVAWYKINSGDSTHPVGSKRANGLGIHDMSGNVWEWTGSLHEPDSPWRVIRGGSWYFLPVHLLSTYRSRHHPAYRYNDVGFRLALD